MSGVVSSVYTVSLWLPLWWCDVTDVYSFLWTNSSAVRLRRLNKLNIYRQRQTFRSPHFPRCVFTPSTCCCFFKAMVMWSSTSPLVEGRFFFFQNSILKSLMLQLDTKAQSFSLQLPCIYGSAFTAFFMSSTAVIGFIGYCPCVCQCTCTRTLFSPFNPSCDVRAVGDDLLYLISQGGFWWVGVCRLSGGWRFQSCPGYCVCSASTKNSQLGPR